MRVAVMGRELDVVVAGSLCLDITPGLEHFDSPNRADFFTPGKVLNVGPVSLSTGGAVSNTGLNMVRLGNRVALMGKVGDDTLGKLVRDLLDRHGGGGADLIVAEGAATGYSVIVAPGRFDRMILHFPGASDTFGADDVDYDLVDRARLFHLGYPPVMARMQAAGGEELRTLFERAKTGGATTSLDMSLPDPASTAGSVDWVVLLAAVLPHVDLFLPSIEEVLFMLDRARFEEFRRRGPEDGVSFFSGDDLHKFGSTLLDLGAKVVAIKCGCRGIYLRTAPVLENLGRAASGYFGRTASGGLIRWAGREFWIPAFRVDEPVNATGSGDAAIAGFLTAFLKGLAARGSLESAAAAGAANLTAADTLSGMISWDALRTAVDDRWQTEPLDVDGKGWRRQGAHWIGPAES